MNYKKISSILFLLLAVFISIALSGIPFLISNRPARMNFEGFAEISGIDISQLNPTNPLLGLSLESMSQGKKNE
jgi:hypothetical protein